MKIVDNKEYLLNEINEYAQKEITKLKEEYESKKEILVKDYEYRLEEIEKEITESHEKEIERIKKQRKSNFELEKRKQILDKEQEIYTKIMDFLYDSIKNSSLSEKKRIFEKIASQIDMISSKKIKEYKTPKGIRLTKRKSHDVLSDFLVIGVVDKNEEYEMSFSELIDKNSIKIHELITKEYFGE